MHAIAAIAAPAALSIVRTLRGGNPAAGALAAQARRSVHASSAAPMGFGSEVCDNDPGILAAEIKRRLESERGARPGAEAPPDAATRFTRLRLAADRPFPCCTQRPT